jgi:hypothetical protein
MALIGFAGTGTYSVVSVFYNKQIRNCGIELTTYKDATKTKILFHHRVDVLASNPSIMQIDAIVDGVLPESPSDGDVIFMNSISNPELSAYEKNLLTYQGSTATWRIDSMTQHSHYRVGAEGVTLRWDNPTLSLVEEDDLLSSAGYDAWFGVEAISGTSNILKQCYDYLKSLPEYAHCTDG